MKEFEIRPKDLLEEYLSLSKDDAIKIFTGKRKNINCVACNSSDVANVFNKNTFDYSCCKNCGSLFQTPRPDIKEFNDFYINSISSKFWAKKFFPTVEKSRIKKVIKPRAIELSRILKKRSALPKSILDVGAGHGVFLKELVCRFKDCTGIAIEPSKSMAQSCIDNGFKVFEDLAENVNIGNQKVSLTCSLEVMEHVHSPINFLSKLVSFTASNGWVFFTTLCADGFDIKFLRQHSNAIFPPHHLNFLSIKGFKILCKRVNLKNIEIMTPGLLDVDIVKNKIKEFPEILPDMSFFHSIFEDEKKSENFQNFLRQNQLSSHVWVLAQKK